MCRKSLDGQLQPSVSVEVVRDSRSLLSQAGMSWLQPPGDARPISSFQSKQTRGPERDKDLLKVMCGISDKARLLSDAFPFIPYYFFVLVALLQHKWGFY